MMLLSETEQLNALMNKKQAKILVTDSGLGGMSICADIARNLRRYKIFEKASLIYYNAWPEQHRGYNRLKDTAERVRVFDRALDGMMKFKPDIIMIACNTLSALYPQTEFSKHAGMPVIDIIRFGVNMMADPLSADPDARVVILGTKTTIASRIHHDLLIEKGVQPAQIISQPCDQLATRIENGPTSGAVVRMIETFMREASEKIDSIGSDVFVALCCTHFGYSSSLIKKKLEAFIHRPVAILDPNEEMAKFLFSIGGHERFSEISLDIQVVSRIVWDHQKVDAISAFIALISADTADALKNYRFDPELFAF